MMANKHCHVFIMLAKVDADLSYRSEDATLPKDQLREA